VSDENDSDELDLDGIEIDLTNFDALQAQAQAPDVAAQAPPDGPSAREYSATTYLAEMEQLYSRGVLKKAKELVRDGHIQEVHPVPVDADPADPDDETPHDRHWVARGSSGDLYDLRVYPSNLSPVPYVTCTCKNGQSLGGRPRCNHSAAALLLALDIPWERV